jgi:hypothetical protein
VEVNEVDRLFHVLSLSMVACAAGCSAGDTSATPAVSTAAGTSATTDIDVSFDRGFSFGPHGDEIHIDAVKGDHTAFVAGGTYRLRGHYVLRSQTPAVLVASITNGRGDDGIPGSQSTVTAGSGTFDLELHILSAGYPHVAFYPSRGGEAFAGAFIGHGDTLFTRGWPHAGE